MFQNLIYCLPILLESATENYYILSLYPGKFVQETHSLH